MTRLLLVLALIVSAFASAQNYQSYTVASGDTLFGIATRYATSAAELQRINSLTDSVIRIGQVISVPVAAPQAPVSPTVDPNSNGQGGSNQRGIIEHTVLQGETLASLAPRYELTEATVRRANASLQGVASDVLLPAGLMLVMPPADGDIVTMPSGNKMSFALQHGLSLSELAEANGVASLSDLEVGQPVFIPAHTNAPTTVPETTLEASAANTASNPFNQNLAPRLQHSAQQLAALQHAGSLLAAYSPAPQLDTFAWPLSGSLRLTSGFGRRNISVGGNTFHGGIDIAASTGTAILSSRAGTVTRSGWGGGYGWVVFVDHPDGSQTRYGHMSKLAVTEGMTVAQGQQLGWVGSTGASTGPHLHFEIRFNGRAVDPLGYLNTQ